MVGEITSSFAATKARYVKMQGVSRGTQYGYSIYEMQVFGAVQAKAPTITPVSGTYKGTQTVTMSTAVKGAEIKYTTDGATPTEDSATNEGPITVDKSVTIKAVTYRKGMLLSDPVQSDIIIEGTISLNKTEATVAIGNKLQLSAITVQSVTFSSDNAGVAKLDAIGLVEGVSKGTATITAKAANGQKATCKITVTDPVHITSIEIAPQNLEIKNKTSETLKLTINPSNTTDDTTVTWKSSDSDVVKVDEKTGMVYAVKAGKADVTATTKAVDNATAKPFTATTTVTVKENNMTDEIGKKLAFDEFDDLLIGQKDNANNYLNLSELIEANNITDDINVEFASSDKAVATIDNDGNVFGLKAGKTIITATVIAIAGDGSKNVYTAEGELTVKTIPLNSIAFDKVIKEMKLGATDTLSIIYNPRNTTDAKDVTWTSSNPSVISVENGKLTANAVGTADITAKVGDKTVTCTITVKEEKKAEQPKPVITNKKSDNKPAAKSVSKAKTGDNNNVVLFLVMFAAAVAMIGVITGKSLRRNRR